MAGDVEAQGLLFVAQLFVFRPFGDRVTAAALGRRASGSGRPYTAKQRALPPLLFVLDPLRGIGGRFQRLEQTAAALAQEVERPRLDQRLDHSLFAGAQT